MVIGPGFGHIFGNIYSIYKKLDFGKLSDIYLAYAKCAGNGPIGIHYYLMFCNVLSIILDLIQGVSQIIVYFLFSC